MADNNPCATPKIRHKRGLLCPDLTMSRPADLAGGRDYGVPILRATSSVNNVGRGPAELHGQRTGHHSMRAAQRVHKSGGGVARFHTKAKLHFKAIPGQGRYWKFHNAARFELWSLDSQGHRKHRITTGPKQDYCLRDLVHSDPGRAHSPSQFVYPSCSQNGNRHHVTLGTSVGWSDVYPSSYYEQYVKLNKVRHSGCYSLVLIVDPTNKILELKEDNNAAAKVVYLTKAGHYRPGQCKGVRDRGVPPGRSF